MIIAAFFWAALSVEAQVFPQRMCENLPEVRPEVKARVAEVAPELAQVSVRELSEKTALGIFARAAAAGWGSVDLLTNSVFREPCTFYFSGEALRAVDAAFVLDLVTVIRGQDKRRQNFEMTALLAGRGKLVVLYERDGIVYRNERLARDFRLASKVVFETPTAGVLENVEGDEAPLGGGESIAHWRVNNTRLCPRDSLSTARIQARANLVREEGL